MLHLRRSCFLVLAFILTVVYVHAQDTIQHVIPDRHNSAANQSKPYVILISADGFRADLAEKYNATNLLKLRAQGVEADYMQSSFPSLTFPNHYTIATGLYPSHHGLVDNSFYDENRSVAYIRSNKRIALDGSWYGGTPIWVLAEQQQMVSASYYWVGSECAIQNTYPTYYYDYSEKIGIDSRLQTVKDWLQLPEDKRPHLITFYFPEVDHAEHKYGPESKETEAAVHFVDESVAKMYQMVSALNLPVNFIFVSDHGMATMDNNKAIGLPKAVDTSKFIVSPGAALLHLYAKDKKDVLPTYENLKKEAVGYDVYLASNLPKRWHYRKKDDKYNRIGDIILVPHLPGFFNITAKAHTGLGEHGFDPAIPEMHATFYAWGPAFKQGKKIGHFENVNVYPLIAKMLGLHYDKHSIDGCVKKLKKILK